MPEAWRTVASERLIDSPWLRLRADTCQLPDGRIVEPWYVMEYPDWCNVLALTPAGNAVLVDEYRHGVGRVVRGLPGGIIDAGEDPAAAAARELREETGYVAQAVVPLGAVEPNPSSHTNRVRMFLALGAERVGEQQPDAHEELDVVEVAWAEVARPGYLANAHHACTAWFAKEWLAAHPKGDDCPAPA